MVKAEAGLVNYLIGLVIQGSGSSVQGLGSGVGCRVWSNFPESH